MEKSCGKGLSGFALKYIAMVSMLCDHANFLVIPPGRLCTLYRSGRQHSDPG